MTVTDNTDELAALQRKYKVTDSLLKTTFDMCVKRDGEIMEQAARIDALTARVEELESDNERLTNARENYWRDAEAQRLKAESAERERDEVRRECERLRRVAEAALTIGYFTGPDEFRGDCVTKSKTVDRKTAYDWNDALNAFLKQKAALPQGSATQPKDTTHD